MLGWSRRRAACSAIIRFHSHRVPVSADWASGLPGVDRSRGLFACVVGPVRLGRVAENVVARGVISTKMLFDRALRREAIIVLNATEDRKRDEAAGLRRWVLQFRIRVGDPVNRLRRPGAVVAASILPDHSAILSSPHSGWSVEMRRMKAMCLRGIRGRPTWQRERRRQSSVKAWRCQAITVSGLTTSRGTLPVGPEIPKNDPGRRGPPPGAEPASEPVGRW